MKKINKLSRSEMKNVLGGLLPGGGSTSLTCYCYCNGGIGVQPIFKTTVNNYDYSNPYSPTAGACGCSSIYVSPTPGFNSGSCIRENYA